MAAKFRYRWQHSPVYIPDGTVITEEMNKIETLQALLGRFSMASKLAARYGTDFFEGTALEGDFKAYENYGIMGLIARAINDYDSEADNFLVYDINGDKYQNGGDFWNIILGGSLTKEEAAAKTEEARMAKFNKYGQDKYDKYLEKAKKDGITPMTKEEYFKTIKVADFNTELANARKNPNNAKNKDFIKDYDYTRYSSYSLGGYGCKMFVALYFAQVISGKSIDPIEMNKFATDNDIYIGDYKNLLGSKEFIELIDAFTNSGNDLFNIDIYHIGKAQVQNLKKDDSIENNPLNKLLEALGANYPNLLHVRANGHSMGITGIKWKEENGEIVGIEEIYTTEANPWKDRGLGKDIDKKYSKTVYNISEIESLDIVGIKINPKYIDTIHEKMFYNNLFFKMFKNKYERDYFKFILNN